MRPETGSAPLSTPSRGPDTRAISQRRGLGRAGRRNLNARGLARFRRRRAQGSFRNTGPGECRCLSKVGSGASAGKSRGRASVVCFVIAARPSGNADAVVSLDGDKPRRLRKAVELAAAAPTLVVVRGDAVAPELLRASDLPFEVLSVVPEPSTTHGEARAVARLAYERGWQRLLVVTSVYHVQRARLIFRRARSCELGLVSAGCPWKRLPLDVCWEIARLVLASTLRRAP